MKKGKKKKKKKKKKTIMLFVFYVCASFIVNTKVQGNVYHTINCYDEEKNGTFEMFLLYKYIFFFDFFSRRVYWSDRC